MLGCIIPTITEVKATDKSSDLSVTSMCVCIHQDTFLVVRKDGSHDLVKPSTKGSSRSWSLSFDYAKLVTGITR